MCNGKYVDSQLVVSICCKPHEYLIGVTVHRYHGGQPMLSRAWRHGEHPPEVGVEEEVMCTPSWECLQLGEILGQPKDQENKSGCVFLHTDSK